MHHRRHQHHVGSPLQGSRMATSGRRSILPPNPRLSVGSKVLEQRLLAVRFDKALDLMITVPASGRLQGDDFFSPCNLSLRRRIGPLAVRLRPCQVRHMRPGLLVCLELELELRYGQGRLVACSCGTPRLCVIGSAGRSSSRAYLTCW